MEHVSKEVMQVMSEVQSMKESGIMTDLTIIVNGERKLRAHKVILAAVSSHFRDFLSNSMNSEVFEVNDCDVEAVEVLLDYAYCQLSPEDSRLQSKPLEVIEIATRFQANGLLKFAEEHLIAENCLQALKHSSLSSSSEASKKLLLDFWKSKMTLENIGNIALVQPNARSEREGSICSSQVDSVSDSIDNVSLASACVKLMSTPAATRTGLITDSNVEQTLNQISSQVESENNVSLNQQNTLSTSQESRSGRKTEDINKRQLSGNVHSKSCKKLRKTSNKVECLDICLMPSFENLFDSNANNSCNWLYLTISCDSDIFITGFGLPTTPDSSYYELQDLSLSIYEHRLQKLLHSERQNAVGGSRPEHGVFHLKKPFFAAKNTFFIIMVQYISSSSGFSPSQNQYETYAKAFRCSDRTITFRYMPSAIIDNKMHFQNFSNPRIPKMYFTLCSSP